MLTLSEKDRESIAIRNESRTLKQFKKRGFIGKCLDNDKTRRRPDFYFKKGNDTIIVEVKTNFSCGLDSEGRHASIHDDRLADGPSWFNPLDKLKDILSNASDQYNQFIEDKTTFRNTPFILALFDESRLIMAPSLLRYDFMGFDQISAVIMPELNRERQTTIKRLGIKILDILDKRQSGIIGRDSFEWRVILNPKADTKVESYLFEPCIVS